MLGIESRKVCVTDMAMIKTHKTITLVFCKRKGAMLNKMMLTKFIWIPGIRPVMIPANIPIAIAIII